MPVLTLPPPPPFTPEQEARIREIFREEIAAWYSAPIPNAKDRDGNGYSRYQADLRGVYAYDAIRNGGVLENRQDATEARATVLEQRANTDDTQDAAEAAEQDQIRAALQSPPPILP